MQKILVGVLILVAVSCSSGGQSASSWDQSQNPQNQGYFIKHPKGWIADWSETGVAVIHPQNRMVWCEVRRHFAQGTSQQFTYRMLDNLKSMFQGLRVVKEAQVQVYRAPNTPDIYGVKFSYQRDGVPVGSVILTATSDGKEFVTHSYAAPAQVYDQEKLTLIPILASLHIEGGGSPGKASGKMQEIRSPQGYWSFLAPAGWRIVNSGDESCNAMLEGPEGQVGVRFNSGLLMKQELTKHIPLPQTDPNLRNRPGPVDYYGEGIKQSTQYEQMRSIPYLSAADLVQNVILPTFQRTAPDIKVLDWKPVSRDQVQFSVTFTDPQKKVICHQEIVVINSSLPHPPGYAFTPDFNLHTAHFVNAPSQTFPKVRNTLWQVLNSFNHSPNFGAALLQRVAIMRKQNLQALQANALRNLRTTQNMGRKTVDTTIRMGEQRRQEGEAWHRVFSGVEKAVDPTTGKQYEVPVGGQYIYANPTSNKVIRSDGPISQNDLPTGFSQLESAGLY